MISKCRNYIDEHRHKCEGFAAFGEDACKTCDLKIDQFKDAVETISQTCKNQTSCQDCPFFYKYVSECMLIHFSPMQLADAYSEKI